MVKVWCIYDLKCLEFIKVYDDVVNFVVVVGFGEGFVFIGLVDGMVKVWKWEVCGKCIVYSLV